MCDMICDCQRCHPVHTHTHRSMPAYINRHTFSCTTWNTLFTCTKAIYSDKKKIMNVCKTSLLLLFEWRGSYGKDTQTYRHTNSNAHRKTSRLTLTLTGYKSSIYILMSEWVQISSEYWRFTVCVFLNNMATQDWVIYVHNRLQRSS